MDNWVKLSVRYYADNKIEALPDADAEVMFTRGLARAGEVGREGFIPVESLPKLARRRRYAASVEALLAAGLWTVAPGGYRVANWDHWQDSLDALARRRTADRERQRRRRAAADESTSVSRDTRPLSRDVSRDVTVAEGEEDKELTGGTAKTHETLSRDEEPPIRCEKHVKTRNPPACGGCADARKTHNRWEIQRTKRLATAPRCAIHPSELAENCAACRSEELAPP